MSAHTPGPWTILNAAHPGIEAEEVATSVVVWGDDEDEAGVHGDTPEEAFANALLIAAAPDLLEALEAFVEADDKQQAHSPETADRARAAIAKATGEV